MNVHMNMHTDTEPYFSDATAFLESTVDATDHFNLPPAPLRLLDTIVQTSAELVPAAWVFLRRRPGFAALAAATLLCAFAAMRPRRRRQSW